MTDEAGRFRFLLPTSGQCRLGIWPAKDYVPMNVEIGDKRGELEPIKLQTGTTLIGRIVDVDAKPLATVYVEARRMNAADKSAAESIYRAALTDAQGNSPSPRCRRENIRLIRARWQAI